MNENFSSYTIKCDAVKKFYLKFAQTSETLVLKLFRFQSSYSKYIWGCIGSSMLLLEIALEFFLMIKIT